MQKIVSTFFCLLFLQSLAFAQVKKKHLIYANPGVLQNAVKVNVTNTASDTTSTVEKVQDFHLMAGQLKAVAVTGMQITKLQPSVIPNKIKSEQPKGVYMLPELYYSRAKGSQEEISFGILIIDAAPLRYNLEKELFEGSIRVLPVELHDDNVKASGVRELESPEDIIISFGAESRNLRISQVNWPPQTVLVSATDPLDSLQVKVITMSQPSGYKQNLAVEPAILLSARPVFQGMGLQSIPVTVALKGVSKHSPVSVIIESSLGGITGGDSVILTGDQPQKVMLRSEGTGPISIKVNNRNYVSNTITVVAVFPWLFLLLSLLGGFIGASAKVLQRRAKFGFRPLAFGSIAGLIAAVAYWGLGIVLIGFSVEARGLNEAMVLGFGLLAGYFGLKMLK